MIRVYERTECGFGGKTIFNVHRDETGYQFIDGKIIATFANKKDAVAFAQKLVDEEDKKKLEVKK